MCLVRRGPYKTETHAAGTGKGRGGEGGEERPCLALHLVTFNEHLFPAILWEFPDKFRLTVSPRCSALLSGSEELTSAGAGDLDDMCRAHVTGSRLWGVAGSPESGTPSLQT